MLLVPASIPAEAQSVPYYGAIVELDKVFYAWTDVLFIQVVAPNFNSDPGEIDYIGNTLDSRITITSTNGSKLDFYKLEESAVDNGVFHGAIFLSGSATAIPGWEGYDGITSGEGPWEGTLKAKDDDIITVKFSETYSGSTNTHEAKALVAWEFATLEWESGQVNPGEGVSITVFDQDMNLSSFYRDSLAVHVYSDSDSIGGTLVLTERENSTDGTSHDIQDSGIFEGQIIFTDCSPIDQQNNICAPQSFNAVFDYSNAEDSETALYVGINTVFAKPGDTITVEYIDYTLPGPNYTSSDSLLFVATTKMSGIKTPTPIPINWAIKKYTDVDNRFTIEYPDDWVVAEGHPKGEEVLFLPDKRDLTVNFQVFWNEDDTLNNHSDSIVLRGTELAHEERCDNVTFAADNRKCSDFKVVDSYTMKTNDDRKVYFVQYTYKLALISGQEHSMNTKIGYIFDGDNSWLMQVESFEGVFDYNSDKIIHMMKSFSLVPTDTDGLITIKFGASSYLSCEPNCFTPNTITISTGGEIVWRNADNTPHTATSGSPTGEPSGVFDSNIINPGQNYSTILRDAGTYNYFCMIHPWMEGKIVVESTIPKWIKNNAAWWADGLIDDSSFLQGIQFLIKEGIMVIPPTVASDSSGSQEVPAWIKNNAGWWAGGQIDDNTFVSGIQYLIKVGIIVVT